VMWRLKHQFRPRSAALVYHFRPTRFGLRM